MGSSAHALGSQLGYPKATTRAGEEHLPLYLVDRDLPGIAIAQLVAAQRRVIEAIGRRTGGQPGTRYLRCTFVPADSRVMCVFEAPEMKFVLEANENGRFPFLRIAEVIECPPPSAPSVDRGEDREEGCS
jgi:hypothetical protein